MIMVTRRKRYLSHACCFRYWKRKKFLPNEKRQWLNFWVWKIKKKRCVWNFQSGNNNNNRISNDSSDKRSRSLYCISRRSVKIFFLEAINFLQAIKITSDKAFRLFSERRKSSILLDSPLWKEKEKEYVNEAVWTRKKPSIALLKSTMHKGK